MYPRTVIFPDSSMRVDTGPLQLGKDWPGVFIRGDEALGMVDEIAAAQSVALLPATGPAAVLLGRISTLLRSCHVENR